MILAAAAILVAILLELFLTSGRSPALYDLRECELTLGLLLGWLIVVALAAPVTESIYRYSYYHLAITQPHGVLAFCILILFADFLYYWSHRLSHRWRWFWASHFPHHTVTRLTFLASLRQGWTDLLSGGWLLWLPLALAGFSPASWNWYFCSLILWQLWIHNEWTDRLGPLEWVFVTPSHHRVHHSIEAKLQNNNFGGILIVWDRLFGSFTDEGKEPITVFGVAEFQPAGANPGRIAFSEWRAMLNPLMIKARN